MLKDLFETLKSRNCAIELKTNHRAESELIVDNATRYIMTKILHFLSVVLEIKGKYRLFNLEWCPRIQSGENRGVPLQVRFL